MRGKSGSSILGDRDDWECSSPIATVASQPNCFFTGNDIYEWCQRSRPMALAYTAGLYDEANHALFALENMRPLPSDSKGARSSPNAMIDYGVAQAANYCPPQHVTVNQVTDVFCAFLRDTPQDRHSLPAILFNNALTKAWPCKHQK
jgi:hypothetical protein